MRAPHSLIAVSVLVVAAGLLALGAYRFDQSRERLRRAEVMTGGHAEAGAAAIRRYACGACHVIPGVAGADGRVGPPLTGVAGRMIIAGRLANTPANLERWIGDPKAVDPSTAMPFMGVRRQEARDIAAYLYAKS